MKIRIERIHTKKTDRFSQLPDGVWHLAGVDKNRTSHHIDFESESVDEAVRIARARPDLFPRIEKANDWEFAYIATHINDAPLNLFYVQSNHGCGWSSDHEWFRSGSGWETISSGRAGHQVVYTLEEARKLLRENANMARHIWPTRVVDSAGVLYSLYDPENDMRLPGSWWRRVQLDAYYLWEKAGCPLDGGNGFWLAAEAAVEDDDGVRDLI